MEVDINIVYEPSQNIETLLNEIREQLTLTGTAIVPAPTRAFTMDVAANTDTYAYTTTDVTAGTPLTFSAGACLTLDLNDANVTWAQFVLLRK